MSNEHTYRLIKDYLKGNLSSREKIDFEKNLISDNTLRELFETEKAIYTSLKLHEVSKVAIKIEELKKKSNLRNKIKRNLILLSSLLLLLFTFCILFWKSNFFSQKDTISKVGKKQSHLILIDKYTSNNQVLSKINSLDLFNKEIKVKTDDIKVVFYDSIVMEKSVVGDLTNKVKNKVNTTIAKEEKEKKEPLLIDTPKVSCNLILNLQDITAEPSCEEYGSGKILFKKEGLSYSINNGISYLKSNSFNNLSYGEYFLKIKDKNGCESKTIETKIEAYTCNYIISNSQNTYWQPDLSTWDDFDLFEIKILNGRTNVLVYTKTIDTSAPFIWNGIDNDGNRLGKGNYIYFIVNKNTNKQLKGQISILD